MTAMPQQMTVMPQQMGGMMGRPPHIMPFVDALKVAVRKYADFDGRASRSEYWWFYVWINLIAIPFMVLDIVALLVLGIEIPIFGSLFQLAYIVPSFSITFRRYHDSGKSGWNLLWALTIVGVFYLIYLTLVEGDAAPNQYGAVPTNTL